MILTLKHHFRYTSTVLFFLFTDRKLWSEEVFCLLHNIKVEVDNFEIIVNSDVPWLYLAEISRFTCRGRVPFVTTPVPTAANRVLIITSPTSTSNSAPRPWYRALMGVASCRFPDGWRQITVKSALTRYRGTCQDCANYMTIISS